MDSVRQGYSLPSIADIDNPVILETGIAGLIKDQSRSFNRKLASDTYSVYLQDQMALSEQWKVRANLRNSHVIAKDEGIETTLGYRKLRYAKNLTIGSLGVVYQPIQNITFYTGYSEGAFVDLNTETNALPDKPETSKQVEMGTKASLFDNKLNLNVALFKTKHENYIYSFPETQSTPNRKDESRGLEIDFVAKPLGNLMLTGNVVWLKPQVKSNATAGINALGITNASVNGTDPIGVSRRSASLWANYAVDCIPGLKLSLGSTYRSASCIDALNVYQVPSYLVMDASARYKIILSNKDAWEIALFVKNLTDKKYYTATTNIGALPGDERSAFLNISYQFK